MKHRGAGRPKVALFGNVVPEYLAWARTRSKKRCKASSIATLKQRLRRFGDFLKDPTFDMHQLTDKHIIDYVRSREGSGIQKQTINLELTTFGAMLNFLTKDGYWLVPPVDITEHLFDEQRIERPKINVLTHEEFQKLIHVAETAGPSSRWISSEVTTAVLAIGYYTGFRHREISHLYWGDINFSTNKIRVQSKPGIWESKNYKNREIDLHPALQEYLQKYRKAAPDLNARARFGPTDWVFPGYKGKCRHSFDKEVLETYQRAGLSEDHQRLGLHLLRRTWATNLLAAGEDLATVMELGGWTSLKAVQRYLTSSVKRKREAIQGLPDVRAEAKPAPTNTIDLAELDALVAAGMPEVAAIKYLRQKASRV